MISSSDDDYNVSDFNTLVKFRRRTRPNSIISGISSTNRRTQSLNLQKPQQYQHYRKSQSRIRSISVRSDNYLPRKSKNEKLFEFEREILHSDLRRNSFRSRNGLRNFVLNPIFDNDELEEDCELGKIDRFGRLSQHNQSLGDLQDDGSLSLDKRNSLRMNRMSSLW